MMQVKYENIAFAPEIMSMAKSVVQMPALNADMNPMV
jgi:hypothetical protein